MAQPAVPPNSINIRQDLRSSWTRACPLRDNSGAWHATRLDIRESKANRLAGITNGNGVQISRCFSAARERRRAHGRSPFPGRSPPAAPLASGDSTHTYSQNVAGLWLKYGAKSLNIEASSHRKIFGCHATIC